eukprot:366274-Chlamydomonas_euryale.AAC.4
MAQVVNGSAQVIHTALFGHAAQHAVWRMCKAAMQHTRGNTLRSRRRCGGVARAGKGECGWRG